MNSRKQVIPRFDTEKTENEAVDIRNPLLHPFIQPSENMFADTFGFLFTLFGFRDLKYRLNPIVDIRSDLMPALRWVIVFCVLAKQKPQDKVFALSKCFKRFINNARENPVQLITKGHFGCGFFPGQHPIQEINGILARKPYTINKRIADIVEQRYIFAVYFDRCIE